MKPPPRIPVEAAAMTLIMQIRSVGAWAMAAVALVGGQVTRGDEASVEVAGRTFAVPAGFTVEAVAGPPLVDRPITADFDEAGALYVTDSSGSNEPLTRQLVDRPHRVVKLIDDDGDGRFDRRTVFADRMMFPAGSMWFAGSLYVAAPPSIWKLTDTDGDGVADRRVEWFAGKTLTGCGNDLHGPYLGPDGWIYWTKGAFAEQTYPRPGRPPLVTKAAHIFRARPDGSGIEPVMTGGMDNPVDVAFSAGGERFFTTTFLQNPAGGLRDGIIHALPGGVYGKDNPSALVGQPRTRPEFLPVMTHLGAAAPSGLALMESTRLGDGWRGNLVAAQFNMRKVSRHVLVPVGATFRTEDSDLLRTADRDFHPTDVIEDADGSLLVVDTGGWYKLCCPTSQLEKPDVLGSILRVRRADAPRLADGRGLGFVWSDAVPAADLAARLGDARPAVRHRAMATLADRGPAALPALRQAIAHADAEVRRNAVWTACRIEGDDARAVARLGLADPDDAVRLAAIHAASVRRDPAAGPALRSIMLGSFRPHARAAAEALGRIDGSDAVADLLAAVAAHADPAVEHSAIAALIEQNAPLPTRVGLSDPRPAVRNAAMVALDQMPAGDLTSRDVVPGLDAPDARTRELAAWVAGHHPDWGDALAERFRERLAAVTVADRDALAEMVGRMIGSAAVRRLMAEVVADPARSDLSRAVAAVAMGRFGGKTVPPEWAEPLAKAVGSDRPEVGAAAVAAVVALPWGKDRPAALVAALVDRAARADRPASERLAALAAVPGGLDPVDPATLRFLLDSVRNDQPTADRARAADILARAKLTDPQRVELAGALGAVGPMELSRLVASFDPARDPAVGAALVDALRAAPARGAVQAGTLRPILDHFGPDVRARGEPILAALDAGAAGRRDRLRDRLARLDGGDVRRGQAVFDGPRAACSSCHAIGYLGGRVGPDLSRIGQIRGDADLVEAILFPSVSFVRGYEPVAVATTAGQVHQGIVASDGAEALVLTEGADRQVRIPRDQIEAVRPGEVSVMPAGFDQMLSDRELADLVAFLRSRR